MGALAASSPLPEEVQEALPSLAKSRRHTGFWQEAPPPLSLRDRSHNNGCPVSVVSSAGPCQSLRTTPSRASLRRAEVMASSSSPPPLPPLSAGHSKGGSALAGQQDNSFAVATKAKVAMRGPQDDSFAARSVADIHPALRGRQDDPFAADRSAVRSTTRGQQDDSFVAAPVVGVRSASGGQRDDPFVAGPKRSQPPSSHSSTPLARERFGGPLSIPRLDDGTPAPAVHRFRSGQTESRSLTLDPLPTGSAASKAVKVDVQSVSESLVESEENGPRRFSKVKHIGRKVVNKVRRVFSPASFSRPFSRSRSRSSVVAASPPPIRRRDFTNPAALSPHSYAVYAALQARLPPPADGPDPFWLERAMLNDTPAVPPSAVRARKISTIPRSPPPAIPLPSLPVEASPLSKGPNPEGRRASAASLTLAELLEQEEGDEVEDVFG